MQIHHWIFPNIEYVLGAILLGLSNSNTIGVANSSSPASQRTSSGSKQALSFSVRGSSWAMCKLGAVSLLLVAVEILGALAFMTFLGRLFNLRPKLTTLLAVGSAVCGVSAIIAAKGAIDAMMKTRLSLSPPSSLSALSLSSVFR